MTILTIKLADINLFALTPHKVTLVRYGTQDHSRWVFRGSLGGSTEEYFYKIWNPAYIRRDNILAAIDSGFCDDCLVPALCGIITHHGICRGYVMHSGRVDREPVDDQFRDLVYLKTEETSFFAAQFSPCHVMNDRGLLSLLDLEGIYPLSEYTQLTRDHCRFKDKTYKQFVTELYMRSYTENIPKSFCKLDKQRLRDCDIAETNASSNVSSNKSLKTRMGRRTARRLRNLFPQRRLIEL